MESRKIFAGVELGGTKAIAVLSDGELMLARETVPTSTPEETLGKLVEILSGWAQAHDIQAIGIASFGPIGLSPDATDYGCILATPKPGWSGASVGPILANALGCPWLIDTDVNAAALAEQFRGACRGRSSVCYITIGTGIGVGLVVDGQPLHGAMHPEAGHLRVRRAIGDDFAGTCPFHGDCIEGLASGPALAARFNGPADKIPDDHSGWENVSSDLAEMIAIISLTAAPEIIILGGTVSLSRAFMLPQLRSKVAARIAGYLPFVNEDFITLAALGNDAGPWGAIALAQRAGKSAA